MTGLDRSIAPIAVAIRSELAESVHHGVAVAIDAGGRVTAFVGDPGAVIYPRSALKPLQASAMVDIGLDVPSEMLALASASHDGAPDHVEGVRRMLAAFDLSESDLGNTSARPYGSAARARARAEGTPPSAIQQNCSGKHAAMLATCRVNGWAIEGYTASCHPVQRAITGAISELASEVLHVGVDGCGAPTHALRLQDLAAAIATVTRDRRSPAIAMGEHPELVGGPTRDVTLAMRAVPGLLVKDGAQGVTVAAMPDGRAVALKIADGSDDCRRALTATALTHIGVELSRDLVEALRVPLFGHGEPVGEIEPLKWTTCVS
ncbi:MAG: asparaginase [Acidimicrobiia bacterium]|nr:asparaginase [Acidimicrobiia bacterium]